MTVISSRKLPHKLNAKQGAMCLERFRLRFLGWDAIFVESEYGGGSSEQSTAYKMSLSFRRSEAKQTGLGGSLSLTVTFCHALALLPGSITRSRWGRR